MNKKIGVAVSEAVEKFVSKGIDNSKIDARILMASVLKVSPHETSFLFNNFLTDEQIDLFSKAVERRLARIPVSHILGYRDFFDHRFIVTSDVLDPRPETEHLVEEALKKNFQNVLDLGTGSGCVILSLLAKKAGSTGLGVDVSKTAINIAEKNAVQMSLQRRVEFKVSDWFNNIKPQKFDLIVSNPPYIHPEKIKFLAPELKHEPLLALTDNKDGLDSYRNIARYAPSFLQSRGHLILEIGFDQEFEVTKILNLNGFQDIKVTRDLNGRQRVITCCIK
jgi:release factor glutamine methyltransferase